MQPPSNIQPSSTQTIKLHPIQQRFLHDDSLFRGFVGGIGSGKTHVGTLDMIRRAKPGCLYMIAAPTYGMLSDATFRTFCTVAESLGALDPIDVRRGAPPSAKLRTGAEILFRSADNPDLLRGPNLSGAWLDEASLMDPDVFTIMIGRLREQGQQGWLSATFTPRGKANWTYEQFATGKPNTAIFHAKTSDNPFLPPMFHDTLANQYTSFQAQQELEGLFIDAGGAIFQRAWFGIIEPARIPSIAGKVRAWDLAATPKDDTKRHDPDYTVGALLGRTTDGTTIILDIERVRASPSDVQSLVRQVAERDGRGTTIFMEQEPGSAGVAMIDHYLRRVLYGFDFRGVRSTGSKADRAMPLAAQAEGRTVKIVRASWNQAFLNEFEAFPSVVHDDIVDAVSLAFTKLADASECNGIPEILIPGPNVFADSTIFARDERQTWTIEHDPNSGFF